MVRRTWDDMAPTGTARTVYLVLWPVGLILVVGGLVADSAGLWNQHAFLLNLVSALTGFCFGVPVVLSLLRSLTERIEMERSARFTEERQHLLRNLEAQALELSRQRAVLEEERREHQAALNAAEEDRRKFGQTVASAQAAVQRVHYLATQRESQGFRLGTVNIDREIGTSCCFRGSCGAAW